MLKYPNEYAYEAKIQCDAWNIELAGTTQQKELKIFTVKDKSVSTYVYADCIYDICTNKFAFDQKFSAIIDSPLFDNIFEIV